MNNLAPMKNCPGGVQGNLNWMPGYQVKILFSLLILLRMEFIMLINDNCQQLFYFSIYYCKYGKFGEFFYSRIVLKDIFATFSIRD